MRRKEQEQERGRGKERERERKGGRESESDKGGKKKYICFTFQQFHFMFTFLVGWAFQTNCPGLFYANCYVKILNTQNESEPVHLIFLPPRQVSSGGGGFTKLNGFNQHSESNSTQHSTDQLNHMNNVNSSAHLSK